MAEPTFRSPDAARAASVPVGSTGGVSPGAVSGPDVSLDVFAKDVANGSDAARLALAQRLKDAGLWTGKISSRFDIKYYGALVKLEELYQGQKSLDKLVGSKTSATRYDVLTGILAGGKAGADKGPSVVEDITAYTPESAKMLIESVIKDTLGRKATTAEITKYTSSLKKIQQQAASTTTYKTVGGKQTRVTTPGISEQQYLLDQVSGTDEGKANKVLGFYNIFMNALGGR
jgi:hypothetical protein